MLYKFRVALLFALALLTFPAVAGTWPPSVDSFREPKLEPNNNWSVIFDEIGRLWIGSGQGLVGFDGRDWITLLPPNGNKIFHPLPLAGRIYVGMTGDLGYFEQDFAQGWVFHSLQTPDTPPIQNLFWVEAVDRSIAFGALNIVYIWSERQGLRWLSIPGLFRVKSLDGRLYGQSTEHGLIAINSETLQWSPVPGGEKLKNSMMIDLVRTHGQLLAVTMNDGLFAQRGDRFETFDLGLNDPGLTINSIAVKDDQHFVLGTNRGLLFYRDGRLGERLALAQGLPGEIVRDSVYTPEGDLWTALETGVARVRLSEDLSQYRDAKRPQIALAITEYAGQMIAGTMRGLFRFDRAEPFGEFAQLIQDSVGLVNALTATPQGLLVARESDVVLLSSDRSKTPVRKLLEGQQYFAGIQAAPDGSTYFVASRRGIDALRLDKDGFRALGPLADFHESVTQIAFDAQGRLWTCNKRGELFYVSELSDWPRSRVRPLKMQTPLQRPSLFRNDNDLLINDQSRFYRLVQEGNEPVLRRDEAFSHPSVQGLNFSRLVPYGDDTLITADGNHLGLLQRDGAGIWEWSDQAFKHLSLDSVVEFIHVDSEQSIWIASSDGITRTRPFLPHGGAGPSPPVLTRVQILSSERSFYPLADPSNELRFLEREKSFRLHMFDAESLHEPLRLRFRPAGETSWSPWQSEFFVDLVDQSFGRGALEVQAADRYDRLSTITRIAYHIVAPWYLSIPALAFYGLFAIILIVLLSQAWTRSRIRKLERDKRELGLIIERETATVRQQAERIRMDLTTKNQLFTNLSHEIKTPLSLIHAPLEAMLHGTIPMSRAQLYLRTALRNARRLSSLVDSILDLQKIDEHQSRLVIEATDLPQLVHTVVEAFRPLADVHGIQLLFLNEMDQFPVEVDPRKIEWIVFNLLSNAMKHSRKNGKVTTRLSQTPTDLLIEVVDTGIGIPLEKQAGLFHRYYQAHPNQAQGFGGTGVGIGLAVVKEYVELHKGLVRFTSQEGHGTSFVVTIPCRVSQKDANPYHPSVAAQQLPLHVDDDASPLSADANQAPADKKHLLVVDDNQELLDFMQLHFQDHFRVTVTDRPQKVLALAKEHLPDAMIFDVMMPDMDGFELAQKIREDPDLSYLPILFLTADQRFASRVKGLSTGDDFLTKPFHTQELLLRLNNLLLAKQRWDSYYQEKHGLGRVSSQAQLQTAADQPPGDELKNLIHTTILQNLGEPFAIDVNSLSEVLDMERSKLYRTCKDLFGESPSEMIRRIRLSEGRQLLIETGRSVADIAYLIGYKSVSHFIESFKKDQGSTPQQYRMARISGGAEPASADVKNR